MLKNGSKISIHFINHWNYKVPTEIESGYTGKVFEVKTVNNKLGIDGNINRSACTCNGELFTPFNAYAWSVIFRDEDTQKIYRHSEIKKGLEEVTDVKDGYIDQISWIK